MPRKSIKIIAEYVDKSVDLTLQMFSLNKG